MYVECLNPSSESSKTNPQKSMSFLQHRAPESTDMAVDKTWQSVKPGLEEIYRKEKIPTARYMQLYTNVYQYCTCNNVMMPPRTCDRRFLSGNELLGKQLYERLEEFLKARLKLITNDGVGKYHEPLLQYYVQHWTDYTMCSAVTHHVFYYLNRHWVRREQEDRQTGVYEIYSLALATWRATLLKELCSPVAEAVITLIRRERDGETINTVFITNIRDSFVDMGVDPNPHVGRKLTYYKEHLEKPLIEETRVYYNKESQEYLNQHPVADYLKKALNRLAEEKKRVERYLDASTMGPLILECEEVLIVNHLSLFYEEFQKFLDAQRDEDMGNMFQLVERTPNGLNEMKEILERHITKQGRDEIASVANEALADPGVYVGKILKVYRHYKRLVLQHFQNHSLFVKALDLACQSFINTNAVTEREKQPNKSSELIVRYCDSLLKKTAKNVEETELEDVFDQIMIAFGYLTSKDAFLKVYSLKLAQRLVEHNTVSEDAEASMISKLKDAMGTFFTSKLEKMVQDININSDLNNNFMRHLEQSGRSLEVDFNVEVLTHGAWPFSVRPNFALPSELETCIERFKTFYAVQQNGRKLNWLYYKSRADIVTNCFKKRFNLMASTYQVAVLLQYNHSIVYTIQQLHERTLIELSDLQQVVRVLCRTNLLMCSWMSADEDVDLPVDAEVRLKEDYNNKKNRININVPLRAADKKEMEEINDSLVMERRYVIEAAVIRIMKSAKKLGHQELIGEVMKQVKNRFTAESKVVKRCIDDLIERDYLERAPDCKDVYLYRA